MASKIKSLRLWCVTNQDGNISLDSFGPTRPEAIINFLKAKMPAAENIERDSVSALSFWTNFADNGFRVEKVLVSAGWECWEKNDE